MSESKKSRGIFIAVEGIDGAGTTTFTGNLTAQLAQMGISAHRTMEPTSGVIGKLLRELLKSHTIPDPAIYALLFAADRRDHWLHEILPELERGNWVVSDRYVLSSLAYQGIDEDVAWVSTLNARAPLPSVTFFLDLPYTVAQDRLRHRHGPRENLEHAEFQEKVSRRYREIASTFGSSLVTLDATASEKHLVRMAIMELRIRGLLAE